MKNEKKIFPETKWFYWCAKLIVTHTRSITCGAPNFKKLSPVSMPLMVSLNFTRMFNLQSQIHVLLTPILFPRK